LEHVLDIATHFIEVNRCWAMSTNPNWNQEGLAIDDLNSVSRKEVGEIGRG
jgi:hypothetical protein